MSLSVLVAMSQKPVEVFDRSMSALEVQPYDQAVIVLDRCQTEIVERAKAVPRAEVVELTGPAGWRSPCLTWNAGLERVTGDTLLMHHGDVILAGDVVETVASLLAKEPAIYFGRVVESDPSVLVGPGHAGPVLNHSRAPRPVLYCFAAKTSALKDIGGWDRDYMGGACYEDDDLCVRLWKAGHDFIFHDGISAVHQSHPRSYYLDESVAFNLGVFLGKHGSRDWFNRETLTGRLTNSWEALNGNGIARWTHTPTR